MEGSGLFHSGTAAGRLRNTDRRQVGSRKELEVSGQTYRAMVSSDWSECLSPNGPFDPLWFSYPNLEPDLSAIFRQYTGNAISLAEAVHRIEELLPAPLSEQQMDAYLDACFQTYTGVPQFIQWCLDNDILFMINTTGTHAYFQRVLAKGLIPRVPVVAANPMLRFDESDCVYMTHDIRETEDKPTNTAAVLRLMNIPPEKLVVMGDSGGDGPHFRWAAGTGAHLIASMAKASLTQYCRANGVPIGTFFGLKYDEGMPRNLVEEMKVDFMELTHVLRSILGTA